MKTLQESLFDKSLVQNDEIEYLVHMVQYVDFISGVTWNFPDWFKGAPKKYAENLSKLFKMNDIDRDFEKLTKKFGLHSWTEFEPDEGYNYAVPQKDPYKEVIRKLIYIIVCTTKVSQAYRGKQISAGSFEPYATKTLKKYTLMNIHPEAQAYNGMCQITIHTDFPDESEGSMGRHFFKILFKDL